MDFNDQKVIENGFHPDSNRGSLASGANVLTITPQNPLLTVTTARWIHKAGGQVATKKSLWLLVTGLCLSIKFE